MDGVSEGGLFDGGVSVESLKSNSSSFVELFVEPTAFASCFFFLRRFQKKRNAIAIRATAPTGTTTATAIFDPPCRPPELTESFVEDAVAGDRVVVDIGSVSPDTNAVSVDVYTWSSLVRVRVLTCLLRVEEELDDDDVEVAKVLDVHSDEDDGREDEAVEDGGELVELGAAVEELGALVVGSRELELCGSEEVLLDGSEAVVLGTNVLVSLVTGGLLDDVWSEVVGE